MNPLMLAAWVFGVCVVCFTGCVTWILAGTIFINALFSRDGAPWRIWLILLTSGSVFVGGIVLLTLYFPF